MTNIISFAKRLEIAINNTGSNLCIGLDPFPKLIPPIFGDSAKIETWDKFFCEIIDIAANKVPIIKPQIGLFEPWGADGISLVGKLAKLAKSKNLLVLLDAKRGDIGSTAEGYANAYLGNNPVIDCDCITLNPYMGLETLSPYIEYAKALGKSIAVLVRTSNPGAKDFQDLLIDGEPLWVKIAKSLKPIEDELLDGDLSSLMVVIGATWPSEAKQLREILPKTQFLIPGYGAQGASASDAMSGLIKNGNSLLGGVVSSSRGILYPKGAFEATSIEEWRGIINNALNYALEELSPNNITT